MSDAADGAEGAGEANEANEANETQLGEDALFALKVAFCYMPRLMDINEYDFPGRVDRTRADVETVREMLLLNDVDPDEVHDEINPDDAANSSW